jgi:hypothetical protein
MKIQYYAKLNEIFQSLPVGVRGEILQTLPGYTGSPDVVGTMLENYNLKCGMNGTLTMQILSQLPVDTKDPIE